MSNSHRLGTALVTGASSGIGKVYADRLAHRGYDLILVARDKDRLTALAAKLSAEAGVKAEVLAADLTDKADLKKVEQRLADDAAITLLLNNAGIGGNGPLALADTDGVEKIVQLNVLAVARLASVAARTFGARKAGTIINVGSVLGLAPEIFPGVYPATKSFVQTLSQSLHNELGNSGVRIQAVLPGATRTEIWERTGKDVEDLPSDWVMEVDEMVDAALVGFDQGEVITIPPLPDIADFQALEAARLKLAPNLSRSHAAARYKVAPAVAA
ncbi:MAG TPA: SDR family oxidoreductase [Alphaproteobacteria bacterium]|nr:SDR family oxidoreductase [Alphaproteobacteria bacterium]